MTVDLSRTVEHNADILEWTCMKNPTGYLAWEDVIRDLNIFAKDEATAIYRVPSVIPSVPSGSDTDPFETILHDWIESLSHRIHACGSNDGYPFKITQDGLFFHKDSSPAYQFQLLVTLGKKNTCTDADSAHKLFEKLSAAAAGQYLGDSNTSVVFGFPRSDLPRAFRDAVNQLAELLQEGMECRARPDIQKAKDDKLDVVAWKEFPDRRASKLILFGQCAIGRHWNQKINELHPGKWCKKNFVGPLAVDPIPAFFVPRTLSEGDATNAGTDQILFDRCRISALCSELLNDQLEKHLWDWIKTNSLNDR